MSDLELWDGVAAKRRMDALSARVARGEPLTTEETESFATDAIAYVSLMSDAFEALRQATVNLFVELPELLPEHTVDEAYGFRPAGYVLGDRLNKLRQAALLRVVRRDGKLHYENALLPVGEGEEPA